MVAKRFELDFGEVHLMAMVPPEAVDTVVYVLEPLKNMPGLEDLVVDGVAIVSVFGMDWERDLTPWAAPKVLKRGNDFGGGAAGFRRRLEEEMIPAVERMITGGSVVRRMIAGISLAGLFAVDTAFVSSHFDAIASVSGSLWYDGYLDRMLSSFTDSCSVDASCRGVSGRVPSSRLSKAYFSLGEQEKNTRNPRMAVIEDRTRMVAEYFSRFVETRLEINPGNHFTDPVGRLRKAIGWLLDNS